MAKPKKPRKPKRKPLPPLPVPANETEARELAAELAKTTATIQKADAAKDAAIAKANETHAADVAGPHDHLVVQIHALEAYCKANAGEPGTEERRSADWPTARLGYRAHPDSVGIVPGFKEESIVSALLKSRRVKFLRREITLNREAILADRSILEKVDGLRILKGESFFFAPTGGTSQAVLRLGKSEVKIENDKPKS